jgi:hypothetical protein
MQYINPIEILGLSGYADAASVNNELVKKAKRKLFADIDLSDNGAFEYYGQQLSKGNCEKAIDELANNEHKEFYLYLASNKLLNEFLASGKETIFKNFTQDSIFKLSEFVKFISPYFAPKFDKALLSAFENDNVELTKAILNTISLIEQADLSSAFKSVSNSIQNKIAEIDEITNDIKNEISVYDEDDIDEVVQLVKVSFPARTLNCLPQYFQSQILKVANSINYLSNSIWDAFDTTQVPTDLTGYLLTLNIGGLDRPTFENNFKIISNKNNERIEQEKNAPVLKKYANFLIQAKVQTQNAKDKKITPGQLLTWVLKNLSIEDINNLPPVFDEIKNQIALSLRTISVEVWNAGLSTSLSSTLISKAMEITGLKLETTEILQKASKQLIELKRKQDESKSTNFISTHEPIKRQFKPVKKEESQTRKWIIGFIAILILYYMYSCLKKPDSSISPTSTPSETQNSNYKENSTYSPPAPQPQYTPPAESRFKGNQLKDGASPLNGCFGKGSYRGNATLTIKNGGSSDAIICLYNIEKEKTIRNEYVRKNSSFTISKIAQGNYKIRVFYGNDWNPELENSCGTNGNFEKDVNFSEFNGSQYFQDSGGQYTIATITLYTVEGGNASSSAIDKTQFFSR